MTVSTISRSSTALSSASGRDATRLSSPFSLSLIAPSSGLLLSCKPSMLVQLSNLAYLEVFGRKRRGTSQLRTKKDLGPDWPLPQSCIFLNRGQRPPCFSVLLSLLLVPPNKGNLPSSPRFHSLEPSPPSFGSNVDELVSHPFSPSLPFPRRNLSTPALVETSVLPSSTSKMSSLVKLLRTFHLNPSPPTLFPPPSPLALALSLSPRSQDVSFQQQTIWRGTYVSTVISEHRFPELRLSWIFSLRVFSTPPSSNRAQRPTSPSPSLELDEDDDDGFDHQTPPYVFSEENMCLNDLPLILSLQSTSIFNVRFLPSHDTPSGPSRVLDLPLPPLLRVMDIYRLYAERIGDNPSLAYSAGTRTVRLSGKEASVHFRSAPSFKVSALT